MNLYIISSFVIWIIGSIIVITCGIKYLDWDLNSEDGVCGIVLGAVCGGLVAPLSLALLLSAIVVYLLFFIFPSKLSKIKFKKLSNDEKIEQLKAELKEMGVEV